MSYPGGFYKAYPAYIVTGGDLILTQGTPGEYGGFHTMIIDVGRSLEVAGSFGCGSDATIKVGGSMDIAGNMNLEDRVLLDVLDDLTVHGMIRLSDSTGIGGLLVGGNLAAQELSIYHFAVQVMGDLYVGSGGASINAADWGGGGKGMTVGGTASLVSLTLQYGYSSKFIVSGAFASIGSLLFDDCSNCSLVAEKAAVSVDTVDFGSSGYGSALIVNTLDAITVVMGGERYDTYNHHYYHVSVDARISAKRVRVGTLSMAKSNGAIVEAVESVLIGNLSLGSGTRLSVERGPINVTHELTLSPHFYTRCPGGNDYVPAGSCVIGSTCNSQMCGWTSPPVCMCDPPFLNATTTQSECYIRKKLCSTGDATTADISCDWLLAYAQKRCFVGPDGVGVFTKGYNASQKCPSMAREKHRMASL